MKSWSEKILRKIAIRIMIPVIGLGILMMTPGCIPVVVNDEHWAPEGHRGDYYYNYYPDSGVYYDRGRSLYFFHHEGQWRESPSLPPTFHLDKERHRELHLDTDKPYMHHPDVSKRFPPGQRKKMDRN